MPIKLIDVYMWVSHVSRLFAYCKGEIYSAKLMQAGISSVPDLCTGAQVC